jgi:heme/copper-type cytochrome/quinol oxidase subunit 3
LYVFKEKTNTKWRERDFIVGHCIIFSDFFCLFMSYEPQTWSSKVEKKLHIMLCTLILFNSLHLTIGLKFILI